MVNLIRAAKKLVQRLPWPLFFPVYHAWYAIHDDFFAERARRREGLRLLADLDLGLVKRSDTVFILGSGSSINAITSARWEIIRAHDTIALNYWLLHPFVPTMYYLSSLPRQPEHEAAYDLLLSSIRRRAAEYRETIKLVSDLNWGNSHQLVADVPPDWRKNQYFVRTPPIVARSEREFAMALRYY